MGKNYEENGFSYQYEVDLSIARMYNSRDCRQCLGKGYFVGHTPTPRGYKPRPPGRNDPCPCGSGKKNKKCCQVKKDAGVASYSYCSCVRKNVRLYG